MAEKFLFRWRAVGVLVASLLAATAHAEMITHGTTSITMDFVTVGNPGNANDTHGPGHGGVDYAYRIGKYEVTENQWDAVAAANGSDLLSDPGYWSGNQPVASISWNEAAMFCNWLTSGNVTQGAYAVNDSGVVTAVDRQGAVSAYGSVYVIPTVNEWYKAAYYDPNKGGPGTPGYWDYPTKQDDPSRPDGIDSAGDTVFDAVFDDGYDQGHPNDVDNAGVRSAYGTMGQGGNVREWNEETDANASPSGHRMYGGAWKTLFPYQKWRELASGVTAGAAGESDLLGFRVANVPEPGSVALLAGGVLAGLVWWKRRR